jgi:hypothetical protein
MTKTAATRWKELSQSEENNRSRLWWSSVVGKDCGISFFAVEASRVDSREGGNPRREQFYACQTAVDLNEYARVGRCRKDSRVFVSKMGNLENGEQILQRWVEAKVRVQW